MKDVVEQILAKQKLLPPSTGQEVAPAHEPEMLLIGCIDARLDITRDIGIPYGKALIERKIAALVAGMSETGTFRSTEAATLEFAVKQRKVKHVVVMGHTHCGGIEACLHGVDLPEVQRFLSPLQPARETVQAHGGDLTAQARAMEQEAVRTSINNLMTYPAVAEAVQAGELQLHGWVIDIATKQLKVLNKATGDFESVV